MKVLITGTTGMVGKAVLLECLEEEKIKEVLVVNRRKLKLTHPKLKEFLVADFLKIDTLEAELKELNGCFHCMGVSSVGKSEEEFTRTTFDLTKVLVDLMYKTSPNCVFNYVSGVGTDSSEKGKVMWARVKGKTENYILKKGFKDAYAFRPGVILPEKGIKSNTALYNIMYILTKPIHGILKRFPKNTTTTALGKAMINSLYHPVHIKILENPEINVLSQKHETLE